MRDPVDREKKIRLPLDPFTCYLERRIKDEYGSANNLAITLGWNARKLSSYLTGVKTDRRKEPEPFDEVDIDTVDKTAVMLGNHLMDIYPSLYDF